MYQVPVQQRNVIPGYPWKSKHLNMIQWLVDFTYVERPPLAAPAAHDVTAAAHALTSALPPVPVATVAYNKEKPLEQICMNNFNYCAATCRRVKLVRLTTSKTSRNSDLNL